MKIILRTDGKTWTILLPTALLPTMFKTAIPKIRARKALRRELRRARREFGHLELVHMRSDDGDEVIITL